MDYQELSAQAKAESVLLGLWAKSLFRPTRELASELREGTFAADIRALLGDCPDAEIVAALKDVDAFGESLREIGLDAARLTLEVDYNRLFVGPSALLAPPYESFYETADLSRDGRGQLRGLPEMEVSAEYAAHDLGMPEEFVEFPDHVAVELEYLSLLAAREARAWETGDAQAASALQEGQERFRARHLGKWIREFARRVAVGAKTTFYPSVALLVEKTVL